MNKYNPIFLKLFFRNFPSVITLTASFTFFSLLLICLINKIPIQESMPIAFMAAIATGLLSVFIITVDPIKDILKSRSLDQIEKAISFYDAGYLGYQDSLIQILNAQMEISLSNLNIVPEKNAVNDIKNRYYEKLWIIKNVLSRVYKNQEKPNLNELLYVIDIIHDSFVNIRNRRGFKFHFYSQQKRIDLIQKECLEPYKLIEFPMPVVLPVVFEFESLKDE